MYNTKWSAPTLQSQRPPVPRPPSLQIMRIRTTSCTAVSNALIHPARRMLKRKTRYELGRVFCELRSRLSRFTQASQASQELNKISNNILTRESVDRYLSTDTDAYTAKPIRFRTLHPPVAQLFPSIILYLSLAPCYVFMNLIGPS